MNTSPLEPPSWSRQRWLLAVGLVFAAQVVMIVLLAERPRRAVPSPQFGATINLALDAKSAQKLAELPALGDPTLFALPNLQGFSGSAWLRFAPLQHQFTNWSEPPRWLEMDAASLGKTFLEFVGTNHTTPSLIADKPLPALAISGPSLTNAPVLTKSEVRLEGDLATRKLLNPAALPSWPHSDILTNTEVQLLVDARGDTQVTTLLASCGRNDADQFAIRFAAGARFQPFQKNGPGEPASSQPTWGKMTFQWHTIPLLITNSASAGL